MFYQIKSWKINKSVELMRKIEKHQGKKCFIVNDYTLNKVADKIKMIIDTEKFDCTTILIKTSNEMQSRERYMQDYVQTFI